PPLLNDKHRKALKDIVDQGPIPAIHNVTRWRLCDLTQWVWEEFRISISTTVLGRELRKMGYRKLSARPCHRTRNLEAMEGFKKTSQPEWQKSKSKKLKGKP
ncbi:helix-turn-helix domain-containing protein, partial [Terasakiella brassicae]|uniref:helix-turn-helix domain-containing protein n=1 Tax=Terasakiella brassicae TaxID=1634917 RepID=UPI00166E0045